MAMSCRMLSVSTTPARAFGWRAAQRCAIAVKVAQPSQPNYEVLFERCISENKLAIERSNSENKLAIERCILENKLSQERTIALVERSFQAGQYILGGLVILNVLVSASAAANDSYISKLLSFLTEQVINH
ncbi:hypothetical protein Agub_g5376 [Astrephomene gubernaculifera]|uniref:Ig-like domain-containing protein n=1 Tax=Astrephomene gubernaculifera TaxID=47775 RepID=A0AAD3HKM9_9CHLO|nr:hypothetical protein Agub_g5376 [Astrephomene gubernaculifera]